MAWTVGVLYAKTNDFLVVHICLFGIRVFGRRGVSQAQGERAKVPWIMSAVRERLTAAKRKKTVFL
jgi:hypothetical protein